MVLAHSYKAEVHNLFSIAGCIIFYYIDLRHFYLFELLISASTD